MFSAINIIIINDDDDNTNHHHHHHHHHHFTLSEEDETGMTTNRSPRFVRTVSLSLPHSPVYPGEGGGG